MTLYENKYRIESARLETWDYSNPWWYYVTINTKKHAFYFGEIKNELMELNELGRKVEQYWKEIPIHYNTVELDYHVVMPNHVHGILIITRTVETRHASSLHKSITLADVIGSFKSAVTKYAHSNDYYNFKWQDRFYDRIIRNEKELLRIRKYIDQNPLKWEFEKHKPENIFDA